ncbi:MAG: rhomboid family intramembrane serine protease [Cyanobacteria bacterium]|nr:rhomboid family intramembrane serine protease [Cyanobacteriota bacterium]
MTSQFILWLYPLLLLGLISTFIRVRMPWKWSWGLIIQSIPIVACGILGLTVGPDWLFAPLGWLLVAIFYLPPRMFYRRFEKNLTELNPDGIRHSVDPIKWMFWGLPGAFWTDITEALALFVEKKPDEAQILLDKWNKPLGVPGSIAEMPSTYKLVGAGIMWQWPEIINEFEKKRASGKVPSAFLIPASRAFAELKRFQDARDCIIEAKLDESNIPLDSLATSLLPYFALTGSIKETGKLLEILSSGKKAFPPYLREFWRGRCFLSAGNLPEARQCLELARQGGNKSALFQERVENQLKMVSDTEAVRTDDSDHKFIPVDIEVLRDDVWRVFRKAAFVQELMSPRRRSPTVIVTIALIIIVFILTDSHNLLSLIPGMPPEVITTGKLLQSEIFQRFALIPPMVLKGEYWRLISYLFLHAHITHLALNLIGLYFFGRVAENIFGTSRLVAIYLVGGLLSGVAHSLLSELPAVGASGAVMAVLGAVAAGIFRMKNQIPHSIWLMEVSWLGGLTAAQVVLDQIIPHVAVFAHLGGLVAGLAIGSLLSLRTFSGDAVDGTQKFVGG